MKKGFLFDRITLLVVVFFFVTGLFIFSLFQKQVVDHAEYAQAAEAQSTSSVVEQAQRGSILASDRSGKLYTLAASEQRYQLLISPRYINDKKNLSELLAKELSELSAEDIFQKIDNDKIYVPPIVGGLSKEKAAEITKKNYTGVFLQPELVRIYPEGSVLAAQVLGFIGADGLGKYGVEAVYDGELRGRPGSELAKKDSFGRLIDVLGGKEAQSGSDLILTIDYNLQFLVETKLKEAIEKYDADSGGIVVMNPKNGAILSIAGQPTFDPNNYSKVPVSEQRSFLLEAASSPYEPGSVVKPITMAMAINDKLVEPTTEESFNAPVTVLDKEITNADGKIYGKQTMTQVLENSDNIAMTWISSLLGSEKEREYFDKVGFGKKSGIDVVGESTGRLPEIKEWNDLLRSNAAFGQGVSATLVQLAAAYSTFGNEGRSVTPHLVEKIVTDGVATDLGLPESKEIFSKETAEKVKEMLASVVVNGHGKRAAVDGVRVGGKTGTAQVASPEGGYYEDQFIGTFAGLFPVENPQFVMVVRLDNPKVVKFAESSAAPTFGEIANWITNYYQLR
jgi:cell division protein FtsI/penicillin-binding protein 2